MKKTGRIIGVAFTLIVGCVYFFYYCYIIKTAWQEQALGAVFCSAIAWWLGGFYDKAVYYFNQLEQRTKELEQSREELQYFLDCGIITIWEYEFSSKRLNYSLGIQKILGFLPGCNTDPMMWADAELIYKDDKKVFHQYVTEFLSGNTVKQQYRIIDAEGEVRWVESCANPVYKNGVLVKVIGTLRDISEEKLTEDLIRRTDKLHIIGELASGVAHEIRNPLTTIKGFMQLIRPKVQENHFVDTVLMEIDRINQIVSEFMILAKPYAANYHFKNVKEMLHDTIALLQPELNLYAVQVWIEEDSDELPPVYCEENQINQVFINVIKNAIEAMPQGGEITIHFKKLPSQISIEITDQGIGIETDKVHRIGTPFYTTKENGTGLGLMVSNKILHNHKGSLTIQSEWQKGTTVTIRLPYNAE